MRERAPHLFDYYKEVTNTEHEACMAMSFDIASYRFRSGGGTILTTSTAIDKLLEQADIGDDIPISCLRPPFRHCYIEFTENRSCSAILYNDETQEHILEGVYLSEVEVHPESSIMSLYEHSPLVDPSKPLRVLDLMFTGSPLGKRNITDDALRVQGFYIQDNSVTITEELTNVKIRYGKDADFSCDLKYLSMALNHTAKALLFINSKQCRTTAFNEKSTASKRIDDLKSSGKIKKQERKLRKTYDRIIISANDSLFRHLSGQNTSDNKTSRRAHWRRGHFRMQPYGQGATERKVIFIEPMVIGGKVAEKKSYEVRQK